MYYFKGISQFNIFSSFIEEYEWKIEKQLLKERVTYYQEYPMFSQMKNEFNRKQISIWPLKEEEIITWFDTLSLLRRITSELFHKGISLEDIHIFMEYPLVFGNHMRTDYLIVLDRLIIVLEFGMFNQDEKRSEERYTKKLQESINHRQILANMVHGNVEVINYVMIYKPEYDRLHRSELIEQKSYNENEIKLLSQFITHKVRLQQTYSAISQLEKICL
jgi:hypothetical protein